MLRFSRAFTLIELLIVVAIIAILAAIAVPNFLEAQVRAKVSRARADMRALMTAIESSAVDRGQYPNRYATTETRISRKVFGQDLTMLTTPVAYLTSLPESSPFDPWESTIWAFNQGRVLRGYEYVGGRIWTTGDTIQPAIRETYVTMGFFPEAIGYPAYYLRAIGPQGVSSSGGLGASAEGRKFRNYDPTNGTSSLGDIFIFQGNRHGFEESY